MGLDLDTQTAAAQTSNERDRLARAVAASKISLEIALSTGERYGTPLAAEFEIENGRLQVSVIAMKGESLIEVTVDPMTGRVVGVETITEEGSLAQAREYREAMKRATKSVRTTLVDGVLANEGYRAISAEPVLENGRSILEIALVRGLEFKTLELELE